jgi:hypothetical protein
MQTYSQSSPDELCSIVGFIEEGIDLANGSLVADHRPAGFVPRP